MARALYQNRSRDLVSHQAPVILSWSTVYGVILYNLLLGTESKPLIHPNARLEGADVDVKSGPLCLLHATHDQRRPDALALVVRMYGEVI